jgi:hypothetical protein
MRSRGINKRLALASRICFVLSRLISSRAINIFTTLYILHVHHQRRSNSFKSTINQFIHQQHTTTANMRSSIFFVAPFVAAAYAQSSDANTTVRI